MVYVNGKGLTLSDLCQSLYVQHWMWNRQLGYLLHPKIPTRDDMRVADLDCGIGYEDTNMFSRSLIRSLESGSSMLQESIHQHASMATIYRMRNSLPPPGSPQIQHWPVSIFSNLFQSSCGESTMLSTWESWSLSWRMMIPSLC